MTEANKKKTTLEKVSCLQYLVQFQKNYAKKVLALIDSNSKVNVMSFVYAKKLGLCIKSTNMGV